MRDGQDYKVMNETFRERGLRRGHLRIIIAAPQPSTFFSSSVCLAQTRIVAFWREKSSLIPSKVSRQNTPLETGIWTRISLSTQLTGRRTCKSKTRWSLPHVPSLYYCHCPSNLKIRCFTTWMRTPITAWKHDKIGSNVPVTGRPPKEIPEVGRMAINGVWLNPQFPTHAKALVTRFQRHHLSPTLSYVDNGGSEMSGCTLPQKHIPHSSQMCFPTMFGKSTLGR